MFNFKSKSKIKKKLWLFMGDLHKNAAGINNKNAKIEVFKKGVNLKKEYRLLTKKSNGLIRKKVLIFLISFFQKNKFLSVYLLLKVRSSLAPTVFKKHTVDIKVLQLMAIVGVGVQHRLASIGKDRFIFSLSTFQSINDYFFSLNQFLKINKNSRWTSMEEIISHFIFYSEGPVLPSGIGYGTVEAPKGHLGVSIVSNGTNKPVRSRIRSSIFVMAGQINSLVQGTSLGDFVVIVSGSNIVVGEIDR